MTRLWNWRDIIQKQAVLFCWVFCLFFNLVREVRMCGDDESGIDLWCTSDEYLLSYSESVHERGKAEASKKILAKLEERWGITPMAIRPPPFSRNSLL